MDETNESGEVEQPVSRPVSRRRWSRWKVTAIAVAVLFVIFLVVAEIGMRVTLGLGNPPLFVHDPDIEYYNKPDGDYVRRGNRIHINHYGMRSDDFPPEKSSPDELRILVVGDSIVFGGAQSDQADIATELLKKSLNDRLDRPVVVGNVSAGSWGTENQLAFIQRFGTFDADMLVLVMNWGDGVDVIYRAPQYQPTEASHPTHKPLLAWQELWSLFLTRYAPGPALPEQSETTPDPVAMAALKKLIALIREKGIEPIVLLHPPRDGVKFTKVADGLRDILKGMGLTVIDLHYSGEDSYRDGLHLNDQGNAELARQLEAAVMQRLNAAPSDDK